jgi:sulfonate transport system substrate-binding protein
MFRTTNARRLAAVFATFAALALLAACGSTNTPANAAAGADTGGAKVVLKLIDPGNSGVLAYAKKQGTLEKELAAANATVQWGGSYASFTATIDAVHSGSVNLLQGATSPVVGYLANSKDIKIFSVYDRVTDPQAPAADGLVVKPESPIRTVKDLIGKRVAVNKGGRGEYLLLLALEEAGVPVDQVQRVYLNPNEAGAAFSAGKVDAWWAIVRSYPQAVAAGARTVITSKEINDQDATVFAARTDLIQQNPKAIAVFLKVLQDLTIESKASPEKFQNVFLDKGPTATSGKLLADDTLTTKYAQVPHAVTDADVVKLQAVADFFVKYKVVPDKVDAKSAVYAAGTP